MIDRQFFDAAAQTGTLIARDGHSLIFGAGGIGLMESVANAAIAGGAKVTGVIPQFMHDNGWGHSAIDETIITEDMSSRKKKIFSLSDAIIALPGGIGTIEELTEAITLKQLGLFKGPLIILNTCNFYNHFLSFLDQVIDKGFMRHDHKQIWEIASSPEEALQAIDNYTGWHDNPIKIARI